MPRRRLFAALAVLVAVLPACGGGGTSSSPPCPTAAEPRAAVNGAVTVCAFDPARFDTKTITTTAGPLTITLINKGEVSHTFKIENADFELKTPGHNDVKTGTVTLAKGTYDFECTISGHAAAGMKGKIVVS